MQINSGGCQQPGIVFNSLFHDFPNELTKVCAGLEHANEFTYVNNVQVEASISAFTHSKIGDVGVLVGSKGIGKTSVIKYLADHKWPLEKCGRLHVDLAANGPTPTEFGRDYYNLPPEERLHKCKLIATTIINIAIAKFFDEHFPPNEAPPTAAFAASMRRDARFLIQTKDRFVPLSDIDLINDVSDTRPDEFHSYLLYFTAQQARQIHTKFVIDELDDQDALFILAIAERLARLRATFEVFSRNETEADASAPERFLSTLIACRRTTFSYVTALHEQLPGMDWFNFHRIDIRSAASLGTILSQRYQAHVSNRELHTGDCDKLKLKFGIQSRDVIIKGRDAFFIRLFESLSEAKQADLILKLCNNDLSDALSATLEVLRNRYDFLIRTDGLFTITAVPGGERAEEVGKVLTPTTVLRCLAYGSQDQEYPIYPICHTRVPNPLRSSVLPHNNRKTSLVKSRILAWFVFRQTQSPTSEFTPTLESIESTMHRFFGLTKDLIRQIVDELHTERLLEHSHGLQRPSEYGGGCILSITPRGSCIWRELQENSVIVQCHREVAELDKSVAFRGRGHDWCMVRAYATDIKKWFVDLPWLCAQFWMVEQKHLEELDDSLVHAFFTEFGTDFVSAHVSKGVAKSAYSLLADDRSGVLKRVIEMCNDLRSDCHDASAARLLAVPPPPH